MRKMIAEIKFAWDDMLGAERSAMRTLLFFGIVMLIMAVASTVAEARPRHYHRVADRGARIALPHPSGCPGRLFCGCGVSVDVFGHPVRSLYLAAAWISRFPRTLAQPGAVAARRGHVMRLRQHIQGDIWLVYDPNGGRGGTWLHARSIRGYAIVQPS